MNYLASLIAILICAGVSLAQAKNAATHCENLNQRLSV